jgi:hypothetical protein
VQKVHINIRLRTDIFSLRVEDDEKERFGKETHEIDPSIICARFIVLVISDGIF